MAADKRKTQKNSNQTIFDNYRVLISSTTPTQPSVKRTSITDEIAREKKLKNDDAEQDITLKKQTLNRLFWFLAIETLIVFCFAFFQATQLLNFRLDEWSFKLLTTVTISQITIMLLVAVSYLFPKKKE